MGWEVKTAFRISFATLRISGRSFSITSLFTRSGTSSVSALASSAFSILTFTAPESSPVRTVIASTSIWSWLLRIITSPMTLTIFSSSTSGYARTPASTNAAAFWVPVSSTIVKIVGPLVCLIWATSPSMATVLPTLPDRSEILYRCGLALDVLDLVDLDLDFFEINIPVRPDLADPDKD